mgnify:CR=1 FL=1
MKEIFGRKILSFKKPIKLIGRELNLPSKKYNETKLNVLLVYPDDYEIGMSSYGYQLLYSSLNRSDKIVCHRSFLPPPEVIEYMKKEDIPIYSWEEGIEAKRYDIIAFSVHYELCYTNILCYLDLARIPLMRDERIEGPVVIAGGCAVTNPLPLSDFIDAFFIGEWDTGLREVLEEVAGIKKKPDRRELLELLAEKEGIFVPGLNDGKRVKRRIEELMEEIDPYMVPLIEIPHNRVTVEISRGCKRGCRFCHAGFVYRPLRERSPREIFRYVERALKQTGFENVSLLSLSATDHTYIEDIIVGLSKSLKNSFTSLSLPSLRADTLTKSIIDSLKEVRKTGFTIAPEAGSQRLRNIINKDITDEEIMETIEKVVEAGWLTIKLYFMVGLPFEEEADIEAIPELIYEINKITKRSKRSVKINVTISPFVPKPHTPFQWWKEIDLDYLKEVIYYIKRKVPKNVEIKNHDPRKSLIEGILSRGDSSTGKIILEAYKKGAVFDEWDEFFNWNAWQIALEGYTKPTIEISEDPPWSFIDTGVSTSYLKREFERAKEIKSSPACSVECRRCGLCNERIKVKLGNCDYYPLIVSPTFSTERRIRYIGFLTRFGPFSLIGQNDFEHIFHRILRRLEVPLSYSQGFHPMPYIYFLDALPLGVIGINEPFEIWTYREIEDVERLKNSMPRGIILKKLVKADDSIPKLSKIKHIKKYMAIVDESRFREIENRENDVKIEKRKGYVIIKWESDKGPYKRLEDLIYCNPRETYIIRRIKLWEDPF